MLHRGLAILETGEHCLQGRGCLVIVIYSASSEQPAVVGRAFLRQASFIIMTALGGRDNESMTGLLCTYWVPGTAHASSTCESIATQTWPSLLAPLHRCTN